MRDNFDKKTIDILSKRVGGRCSNPNCRKLTSGPKQSADGAINIGVGAHITAASKGGPRYDATSSKEERTSIENAIWLCQSCSKLIDSDELRYSKSILLEWKESSEREALDELEGRKDFRPKDVAVPWNLKAVRLSLLNAYENDSETELHAILKENSFLFYELYSRKYGIQPAFHEVDFDGKRHCDFAWLNDNSDGPEWVLLKVES